MTELIVGMKAPDFAAYNSQAELLRLEDFVGKNLVLFFYPKDLTPACTKEACSFRDCFSKFESLETKILGVSLDSAALHAEFRSKHDLPFELLSDPQGKIVSAFDAWNRWKFLGKNPLSVQRKTVLIDWRGYVRRIWNKVDIKTHVAEVEHAAMIQQGLRYDIKAKEMGISGKPVMPVVNNN